MPLTHSRGLFRPTPTGGYGIVVTNDTGGASVRGTVVCPSSDVNRAVSNCGADEPDAVGVVYTDGVADGQPILVLTGGLGQVLLEENTGATRENWVRTSVTEAGTADATNADPPGGGVTEIDRHFREIGHAAETVAAGGVGTNVLCFCWLHFN